MPSKWKMKYKNIQYVRINEMTQNNNLNCNIDNNKRKMTNTTVRKLQGKENKNDKVLLL